MEIGRYFCNDPAAPKPNSPTHIGTNVLLEAEGRLLLEKRWDCGQWGLIGGRLRSGSRRLCLALMDDGVILQQIRVAVRALRVFVAVIKVAVCTFG